jgi:hypothetical protein
MADFTPLTGQIKRRRFMALDLESKDGPTQKPGFTRPFLAGLYTGHGPGEGYHHYRNRNKADGLPWEEEYYKPDGCIDRVMRYILRKEFKGRIIYAHNAGRFDYLFLLPWVMEFGRSLGFEWEVVPVSSAIQLLKIVQPASHAEWLFLDSFKLIPLALDTAAKTFGFEGKVSHDLSLPEDDPAWFEYLKGDCVQLYKVLEKFHDLVENHLLGEVGMTAPSTAVKILRRRYLKSPIPRNEETHDFVRAGYFGGRVEVFRETGDSLRYYDINSSYPAGMLETMPGGTAVWFHDTPPDRYLEKHIGFCDVDVIVPDMHIPPLPVKQDAPGSVARGKLIFPTGKLRGTWEWSELQMALEYGCRIERFRSSCWFDPIPLFGEFVRELYQYRDKSRPDFNAALAAVAKLMLNSTYGKFGMKTLRQKIYHRDDPNLPDNAAPANGELDCPVWYSEEHADACYVMPQVSARVTSLSRQRLYRGMMQSKEALCYVDTDSLLTPVFMPSSTELGAFKDEYPEYSGRINGEFLAPKLYVLWVGDEDDAEFRQTKAKGVDCANVPIVVSPTTGVIRIATNEEVAAADDSIDGSINIGQERCRVRSVMGRPEREKVLFELYKVLARGGTITMKRLEKVGSLAHAGFSRGPQLITVPRTLKLESGKREHLGDGNTRPFRLEMW